MASVGELWVKQAKEVMARDSSGWVTGKIVPFAVSMATAIYGAKSPQLEATIQAARQLLSAIP